MTSEVKKIPIGAPPQKAQPPSIDDILNTLPKRLQKKSKTTLQLENIKVNEDGLLLHSDGSLGSSVRNLLEFHFGGSEDDMPKDYPLFKSIVVMKKKQKSSKKSVNTSVENAWVVFDE
jgi:hypothetical protein